MINMTGRELYKKYTNRDFSGSAADVYGQTLMTIFAHIHTDIFPLLEKAEKENKQLDFKDISDELLSLQDEILPDDIEFI